MSQPTWVSNTLNEGDNVTPFDPDAVVGINYTLSDYITTVAFHCPTYLAAMYRVNANMTVYRTLYSGIFPPLQPYPWVRAYHGADVLLLFGAENTIAYQDPGPNVLQAGIYFRSAVAAFVKDPKDGLAEFGWPKYTGAGEFNRASLSLIFSDPFLFSKSNPQYRCRMVHPNPSTPNLTFP